MLDATLGTVRKCFKCKRERSMEEFPTTSSKFFPGRHSIICLDCLERLAQPDQLDEVDKLLQWLDKPFIPDQWTSLYRQYKEHTLRQYLKILDEMSSYQNLNWTFTNEQWKEAMRENTMVDHIAGVSDAWLAQMARKWPAEMDRTVEDYHYLENFYNNLLATQNLVTATQQDDAKRLCEIGLLINKKIRGGLDAKNEMAMYHNIIKAEGFEPKNSKSIGDFDSVGELYTWLEKRKWKPRWHTEPQDSVDHTMKQFQAYTKRVIEGEGSLGDQVEDRRKQLELAEKLEEQGTTITEEEALATVEYEGDITDDDDALN